ncbi:hypothetical protein JHK87_001145 [Glycine soja]|nr:hypothetical protein JHK87_001145 [Glycine soja]
MSQKNDDLGLIHRWIIVKFKHQVRNPIPSILTVGNFKSFLSSEENPSHFSLLFSHRNLKLGRASLRGEERVGAAQEEEEDWDRQSPTQVITEICGFVTILSGTFLLHKTKDMADGAPLRRRGAPPYHLQGCHATGTTHRSAMILALVTHKRRFVGGFEFIPSPPPTYYANLHKNVSDVLTVDQIKQCKELGILVDRDDQGTLLQKGTYSAFVELHIEQRPILEDEGTHLGANILVLPNLPHPQQCNILGCASTITQVVGGEKEKQRGFYVEGNSPQVPLLNIEGTGHGSKRKELATIDLEIKNARAKKAKVPTLSV